MAMPSQTSNKKATASDRQPNAALNSTSKENASLNFVQKILAEDGKSVLVPKNLLASDDRGDNQDQKNRHHLFPPSFNIDKSAPKNESEHVETLYNRVAEPLDFIQVASEFDANAAYETMNAEFPWLQEANSLAISWMATSAKSNGHFRIPNIVLNGPPGIGKSRWTKRIIQMCNTLSSNPNDSVSQISCAGLRETLNILGCDQAYRSSQPGIWYEAIASSRAANPIIILDEIEKAHLNVCYAMLAYLEPETSSHYFCPFFRTSLDLSRINYISTTNDIRMLPEALRSRMELIECSSPKEEDIASIAPAIANEIKKSLHLENMEFTPDLKKVMAVFHDERNVRGVRKELQNQIMNVIWTRPTEHQISARPPRRFGLL